MNLRVLTIGLSLVFIACNRNSQNVPNELYGRWILDSTSKNGGKMLPDGYTELNLLSDKSFILQRNYSDVSSDYRGIYSYKRNVDTSLHILFLCIYSDQSKDSIIWSKCIKVLNLNDTSLKTQEEDSYPISDSTVIKINKLNIYRRIGIID